MTPNIAIIRWSDSSFAQLEWDNGRFRASEFATLDPEDSYNELNYNQLQFAVLDPETMTSLALSSFTIQNDEGTELRAADPEELWDMIEYLLDTHFADGDDAQD